MRQQQAHQEQEPQNKKIWLVIISLVLLAPVGIILMYILTDWSKSTKKKVAIGASIWFVFALIFGQVNQPESTPPENTQSAPVEKSEAQVSKPAIEIDDAAIENDYLVIKTDKDTYTISLSTGSGYQFSAEARSTVTINDNEITPRTEGIDTFTQEFTLQPGDNAFNIVATNKAGRDEKKLIIRYEPKPATSSTAVDDPVFEAEVTCKQHAEKQLLVEDINMGYNQSSIKRKNPDGTILIKANIADSQGLWRQQKPLGLSLIHI